MNRMPWYRNSLVVLASGLALASTAACSKKDSESEKAQKPAETKPAEAAKPAAAEAKPAAEAAKPAAEDEAKKKAEKAKKVADAIAKAEADAATERERWTDEVTSAAKKLAETPFASLDEAMKAVLAGSHRKPGNADRDAFRHPAETLAFFGLTPSSNVVEMGVGGGWYTEVIAPTVATAGHYTGGVYDAEGSKEEMRTVYGMRQQAFFSNSTELYGKAKTFDYGAEQIKIGEPGSADLVLAIREMHNWQRRGSFDNNVKAIVAVLKPGGTLGVVQHRAKEGADAKESAELGYLPEAWLVEKLEAAGLKLVEKSDINANDKDTADHENGVWALPPSLTNGDKDKAKYEAIGESDRMTLRFEKPASE